MGEFRSYVLIELFNLLPSVARLLYESVLELFNSATSATAKSDVPGSSKNNGACNDSDDDDTNADGCGDDASSSVHHSTDDVKRNSTGSSVLDVIDKVTLARGPTAALRCGSTTVLRLGGLWISPRVNGADDHYGSTVGYGSVSIPHPGTSRVKYPIHSYV